MKRFAFRLERVLQLRVQAEDEQARVLGRALQEEAERRRAYEAAVARCDVAMAQCAAPAPDMRTAGMLGSLSLVAEATRAEAGFAEEALREAMERRAQEQERYEAARQARRALEKLKEQQYAAWIAGVQRLEQAAIDEIALRPSATEEMR